MQVKDQVKSVEQANTEEHVENATIFDQTIDGVSRMKVCAKGVNTLLGASILVNQCVEELDSLADALKDGENEHPEVEAWDMRSQLVEYKDGDLDQRVKDHVAILKKATVPRRIVILAVSVNYMWCLISV